MTLVEQLPNTNNRDELVTECGDDFQAYLVIGFTEQVPPLRVTDERVRRARVARMARAGFSRKRAVIFPMDILHAELYVRSAGAFYRCGKGNRWREENDRPVRAGDMA